MMTVPGAKLWIISEPPKFLVTPRNPTDAVEGQSVLIDCQAHGNPKPTIQWDKETDLNGFDHNRLVKIHTDY